jgi:hypothetical protein
MAGIAAYLLIIILNVVSILHSKEDWKIGLKNKTWPFCGLKETCLTGKNKHRLRME